MKKDREFINLYDRQFATYHNRNILAKIILVNLLIIMIIFFLSEEWYDEILLFELLFITAFCIECAIILVRYQEGYRFRSKGITYHRFFRRKYVPYNEINAIVISYAKALYKSRGYLGKYRKGKNNKREFIPYPWLTLCSKAPEGINKPYEFDLAGPTVDHMLRKKGFLYSFRWNARVMPKLFLNFQGNYYVTHSLYTTYRGEFEELMQEYAISQERICIIPDKEKHKF